MPPTPFEYEQFTQHINVSRETFLRLQTFHDLLLKWQSRINLISPNTIDAIWQRHILDSAQLAEHIPDSTERLIDIGSGGGFPGVILAILESALNITLVESDQRKATFLREALRITGTQATVINDRIEAIAALRADIITARACAPLTRLLAWSTPHLKENAFCLFLKGQNCIKEVDAALQSGWSFDYDQIKSMTDDRATLLKIKNITTG